MSTEFTFDIYTGKDGTPVVHVQTEGMPEDADGPICRVYLNDAVVHENPALPLDGHGHTDIDKANGFITDMNGFLWKFIPTDSLFGSDRIKMVSDNTEGGGYGCMGFEDAVDELLDGGYLDEDIVKAYKE